MSFSLYIHIPYCDSKCPYCDFNSYAMKRWPEEEYTTALIRELETRAREPHWAGGSIRTIFFGGGTPSLFAPVSIGAVLDAAHRLFGIEDDAEITLEANPGTIDLDKLRGFSAAGIGRLSLGAQSFDPRLLSFLGRIHDADQTRQAAADARRSGIEQLSLDLIFSLPGQSVEDAASDIAAAAALEPDHISAYNLTFEDGTAFGAALKAGRMRPLDEELQAAMYAMVRRELPARGYPMYEISNFAPPAHQARHNLTYWRAQSYLGIGAGAHSYAALGPCGRRWWNERVPARYIEKVRGGGSAESGSETLDETVSAAEFAFLNLRLAEGLPLDRFRQRFGYELTEHFAGRLERLIGCGLLIHEDDRLRLSDRGLELADSVFAEFL